ncbi:PAS domain S-box protein [Coleofasciculus sp. E1-EBD-02]|uniref:PAS domain S-box protein n=1 Tax=Coleofasciculus sp. E1-EBD-02 TaxID=3068481 RepID=UPI0033038B16
MRFAPNSTPLTRQQLWLVIVLSGFALFLAHGLALLYQVQPGLSLWFFPSGVAIALTLWFEWIGLILTGIISLVIAPFWGHGDWTGLLRCTDIIVPLITWLLYRQLWQGSLSLKRLADAVVFIASATLAASCTSATVHSLALLAWGKITPSTLLQNVSYNWLGQAIGILAVAPTALLFITRFWQNKGWLPDSDQESSSVWSLSLHQWLELLGLGFLSIGIATLTVWATQDSGLTFERLLYIGFLPILWAAIRFGVMGGMLLVSFSIAVTALDYLIFYPSALSLSPLPISADILSLHQLSLLTQGIVSLLLGAAIAQPETVTAKPAADSNSLTRAQLNALLTKAYTRLQEFNQKLRQSEERFRTSVENMLDCFGIYTAIRDESGEIVDFRIDYVNASACRDNFLSKEEQIGQSLCHLFPAHRETGLFWDYSQVVETGEPLIKESLIYEDNFGQQRLSRAYDIRATKLGDGFIATWRDITECKQVEAERQHLAHQVQQQVGLLQGILSASVDHIYLYDRHGKYLYVSVSAAKALGRQPSDMVGKTWQALGLPATLMESYDAQRQLVFETGQSLTDEISFPTVQGIRQYEYILSPVANAEGTIETVVATVRDITERKQIQAELYRRQQEYQTLIENLPDIIARFDRQLRHLYVSPTIEPVTGRAAAEFIGKTNRELGMPHQQCEVWDSALETVFATGEPTTIKFDFLDQNDVTRYYEARLVPELTQDGSIPSVLWITRDITDLTQAELALRESEERLRLALDAAKLGIWDYDVPAGKLIWSNSCKLMFGLPADEADYDYQVFTNCLHPDDRDRVNHTVADALQTKQDYTCDYRIIHGDGTQRWIAAKGRAFYDENDAPTRMMGVVLDITDRKQAEVQLQEREELFRTSVETMLDCFGIYSAIRDESGKIIDFRIDYVNTAVCESNCLSQDKQIGKGLCQILPAHRETGLFAEYCQAVETRQPLVKESVLYTDNYGQQYLSRVFDICIAPFRDGFIATWRDVTERQQIQAELYRRQQEFQALVENSPDIISRIDQELRHVYVNPAIEAVTGLSAQAFLGKTHRELGIPEPISTQWQTTLREILATGKERITEFDFLTPDNTTRYYQARMVPELAEDGTVESVLGIARDITDIKLAEAERNQLLVREQEARAVAEAASRTKDEFLAIVSHELRSPLNAILGWAKLLRIRQLDEQKTNRALETIERNAKAQAQLIDDLLDISRIIRGNIRLNICPTNLVSVIEAALDTVRPLATDKQIHIDCQFDAAAVAWVSGDTNRLQQVIWNLLSNAVKFTPAGGRVEIYLEPVDHFAQIRVRDTGKGIRPEFLPHIFESFRQADSTTARKQIGLGLGLAIAQNLVQLQGGTIHAESPGEGQGATFIVKLPLLDDDDKKITADDGIDSSLTFDTSLLSRIRVLVVDDDADTREVLIAVLEQYGAMATATASATEALERLQQMNYDLLLSDIGMPGGNGYRLIRRIRALPSAQGGQIPAVAVTAYAREEDRLQALSAGFQMHIPKPIEPKQLLKVIVQLAARTASTGDFLNGFDE